MKPEQLYSFDPPQIARSPSDIAKSPKGDDLCVKEMPKYFHWFAIEAHNTTVNIMDTVIEVNCYNNIEKIQKSTMDDLFKSLEYIMKIYTYSSNYYHALIKKKEISMTAPLARTLDTFFFSSLRIYRNFLLQCLHQLPTGYNLAKSSVYFSDFHIMVVNLLGTVFNILVSDFEPHDMDIARTETEAYAISVLQHSMCSFIILGMPMTSKNVELWMYFGCGQLLLKTKNCISLIQRFNRRTNRFFSRVYGIVHTLIKKQIEKREMCETYPRELTTKCCDEDEILSDHCFLCRKQNIICKFYDNETKPYLKPNVDLMTDLSATLETNGKIQVMSYPYKVGSSHPKGFSQIIEVLKKLHKLHTRGYAHGDVRIENIIYSSNGKDAFIIDYDFAGCEKQLYPKNYNPRVPGRHVNAFEHQQMIPYHDCFSIHYCIRKQYGYLTARQASALGSLKRKLGPGLKVLIELFTK